MGVTTLSLVSRR